MVPITVSVPATQTPQCTVSPRVASASMRRSIASAEASPSAGTPSYTEMSTMSGMSQSRSARSVTPMPWSVDARPASP